MSAQNPRRLLDLERMHLFRENALVYSYLEFLPRELFLPLFIDAIHGRHTKPLGSWCKPVPLSACLWGTSLPCLVWGPYEQLWKHLMSCWPRRFTLGEPDAGSLIGSWASQKRPLGWAKGVIQGWSRGLWGWQWRGWRPGFWGWSGCWAGGNIAVGCYSPLQGIFLTQGSNSGLPHCRQLLYHLSHQGSLILEINKMKHVKVLVLDLV